MAIISPKIIRPLLICLALNMLHLSVPASGHSQDHSASHLLLPGDLIDIKVHRQEDLNMPVRVGHDGYIRFPLCGRIQAQGKSIAQIENIIAKGLISARYEKPQVIAHVTMYTPRMVYVFGEIKGGTSAKTALEIPPGGQITVMQAISEAGGVTEKADIWNIVILRTNEDKQQEKIKVDLTRIMSAKDPEGLDVKLIPKDVVTVPAMRQIFVYGRVNGPGGFWAPHGDPLTLSRVIALAGGTERPASEKMLRIIRGDQVLKVDLSEMINDDKTSADIEINPGDVVYVPQSRW